MHHHSAKDSKSGLLRRNSSVNINDTKIAGLYDLEHTIGKGHFAVVKLARHVFTGEKVAVKVIDKTKLDAESAADLFNEVRCMKLVEHPNIVRLYEVIDTQTKLFLILELGDFDLYEFLMRHAEKGCKESEAQQYFSQIIKAIDFCHRLYVVHRDLKPENVVFFEKLGMVKLTDFGFSNLYAPGQQLNTSCGSLAYSAPEILLGDAYIPQAIDVWSLGVILYMLVCGRLPFQEANDSETLTKILDCRYSIPDTISNGCKDLIQRMLVRDPTKRATLDYITKSPWVRAGDKGHAEALPLVSRTNLPENAHETIIEQMVVGGLGTEDNILRAIESKEYSYLTATYYLLAERVLSAYREEQAIRLRELSTGTDLEDDAVSELISNSSTQINNTARSRSNSWRGQRRACTILKEESEEEMSTYLRSSSRQSSRYYTKREQTSRQTASRASSIESFRSSSMQQSENQLPDLSELFDIDERRVNKKLSVIPAEEDEETSDSHLVSISEASPKPSISNGSPKSNLSCSNLGFSNNFVFDELSPIREMMEASVNNPFASEDFSSLYDDSSELMEEPLDVDEECPPTKRRPNERQRAVSSSDEDERRGLSLRRRRYTSSRNNLKHVDAIDSPSFLPRTPSEPTTINQLPKVVRRAKPPILRRNSSPSVAMFGPGGMRSSRDRVSPQAIQELLEFSRLSASMKRTASPDSRISSRSPSPESRLSSGRVSPAISTMSGIVSRLKSSSLMPATSGMRKLSSSPHLLGICEETEESSDTLANTFYTVQAHKSSLASSGSSMFTVGTGTKANGSLSRGVRSASTGFALSGRNQRSMDSIGDLPSLPERASSSASNPPIQSYSSLRMVRPRHTLMSPEMRRYEQHQRFISRSKRSTSCSSSETSDDETKGRRRQVLGAAATLYCKRNTFDENRPDDDPPPKDENRGQQPTTEMTSKTTTGKTENKTGTAPAATDNSSTGQTSRSNNMSNNNTATVSIPPQVYSY
ncbi:hypothetical protein M3Y97_00422800 [Aphelenchoides bicaudatus]|nr:hypothetical protein M3Y97_00422800 [Aphelenchoides bicaudatus]